MLQPFFKQQNIPIGRDSFFDLLAGNKLLVRKRKRSMLGRCFCLSLEQTSPKFMTAHINEDNIALKKVIDRNNFIIIGLFIINLFPTVAFYLDGNGVWNWFLIILATSLIFWSVPNFIIDKMQLSKKALFYKGLKVHLFKRYATNGDIINRSIRKQFPGHRNIINPLSIRKKLIETYTTEKAHLFFFIFCFLTSIYAFKVNHFIQAIVIVVGNTIFNLYPILLQQYNRIRYNNALATKTKTS